MLHACFFKLISISSFLSTAFFPAYLIFCLGPNFFFFKHKFYFSCRFWCSRRPVEAYDSHAHCTSSSSSSSNGRSSWRKAASQWPRLLTGQPRGQWVSTYMCAHFHMVLKKRKKSYIRRILLVNVINWLERMHTYITTIHLEFFLLLFITSRWMHLKTSGQHIFHSHKEHLTIFFFPFFLVNIVKKSITT